MRHQFWHRGMRLALALGASVLFAAPGRADDTPARFGLALPMSGSQALYGTDQVKAAALAVEDINKAGGVNGRKLEMITVDTQADPQLGINAANRFVSVDKVPVFAVGWSAVVKAMAPTANRANVLQLSVGANSPQIAKLGDYVYTTFPLATVNLTALAKYSYETLGKRRAAVLYINNETGSESAKIYKDAFEKAGGEVVAYEAYDPKATDYTGMLLRVRAANPDIIHLHGLVADMPQVIAQMRQLGLQQRVTSYSAAQNPKLVQQLGKGAEGLIVTSLAPGASDNPNIAPFVERWTKELGHAQNGMESVEYLYDLPYIVAELYRWIDKQKLPATGENLRRALLEIKNFNLPLTGRLTVLDDHTVDKPVYLFTVKDGEFVPLAKLN